MRRITHLPAMICGITLRGLLARGYHADVHDVRSRRASGSARSSWSPTCRAARTRWQVKPEGIVRVLVNGEVDRRERRAHRRTAGPRAAHRERSAMKAVVFHGPARGGRDRGRRGARPRAPARCASRSRAAGLCHSDLSVIDGTIPYPVPVVLGHEGAGVVDAGRRRRHAASRKATRSSSRRSRTAAAARRARAASPTECRNAPNPKDATAVHARRHAGLPVRQRVGVRRARRWCASRARSRSTRACRSTARR